MEVVITCKNFESAEAVYDLLTDPLKGTGCLEGEKVCTDPHEMVPDMMVFDLTKDEMAQVEQLPGVHTVYEYREPVVQHCYNRVIQVGRPMVSSTAFLSGTVAGTAVPGVSGITKAIPHHLYYCQTYEPSFTHTLPVSNVNIPFIDCSNVDILVIDSGIDTTHNDFLGPDGNSRVVKFDWTQLRDDSNNQILNTMPANFYDSDSGGHGTSCASLAAGNRCGAAKNAKIYFLNYYVPPMSAISCLKLALAFQKAKKSNLYGLSSTRPTICTNSWNYTDSAILAQPGGNIGSQKSLTNVLQSEVGSLSNVLSPTSLLMSGFILDKDFGAYRGRLPNRNDVADGYVRSIVAEGMHILFSAGNNGSYNTLDPNFRLDSHVFASINTSNYTLSGWVAIPRTKDNEGAYTINTEYTQGGSAYGVRAGKLKYLGMYTFDYISSPCIGYNQDINTYPAITVGDIMPLGNELSATSVGEACQIFATNKIIKEADDTTLGNITIDNTTRYTSRRGPFFTKTYYSNFGPKVDVYVPGGGAWSAYTSQRSVSLTDPLIVAPVSNEYYGFFGGTSASCPIAAGILATYLAEYPNATPLAAKRWLIDNGVKGNIMEGPTTYLPVSSYDGTTQKVLQYPFGCTTTIDAYIPSLDWMYTLDKNLYNAAISVDFIPTPGFGEGTLNDLFFYGRMIDSNNVVPQVYPSRGLISSSTTTTLTALSTTFVRSVSTTARVTN